MFLRSNRSRQSFGFPYLAIHSGQRAVEPLDVAQFIDFPFHLESDAGGIVFCLLRFDLPDRLVKSSLEAQRFGREAHGCRVTAASRDAEIDETVDFVCFLIA